MFKRIYWDGFFMALVILGLFQDFLGREEYINFISRYWVKGIYSVPIALVALVFLLYDLGRLKREFNFFTKGRN